MELHEQSIAALTTARPQQEFYDSSFNQRGSFGVRVSKRGRKVFFLIFPENGRRKRITIGSYPLVSVAEAREAAYDVLRFGSASDRPKNFRELCALFVRRAPDKWNLKTRREYERMIEKELLPVWGGRRIRDVGRADVILLLERVRLDRESPVMADRLGALVSAIFNFARERAIIEENPAARLEKPLRDPETSDRALMKADDFRLLWTGCERESPSVRGAIRFLMLTGRMVSEVLALRWADIELENWKLKDKHGRERLLPLGPQALQLLRDLRKISAGEFVFTARGAKRPLSQIRAAMSRVCAQPSVDVVWTTRDIRRSVESALRGLRVRPDVIEEFLGRTSTRLPFQPDAEYDYSNDLRAAAGLWGKKMNEYTRPTKKQPTGAKIIPLFPE